MHRLVDGGDLFLFVDKGIIVKPLDDLARLSVDQIDNVEATRSHQIGVDERLVEHTGKLVLCGRELERDVVDVSRAVARVAAQTMRPDQML